MLKKERSGLCFCPATQCDIKGDTLQYSTVQSRTRTVRETTSHGTSRSPPRDQKEIVHLALSRFASRGNGLATIQNGPTFWGAQSTASHSVAVQGTQGCDLQSVSRHVHNDRMAQCERVLDSSFSSLSARHVSNGPRLSAAHSLAQEPGRVPRPPVTAGARPPSGGPEAGNCSTGCPQCRSCTVLSMASAHCLNWSENERTHRHTTAAHSPSSTVHMGCQQGSPLSTTGAQTAIERKWMFPGLLEAGLDWASALQLTLPRSRPHLHTLQDAAGLAAATAAGGMIQSTSI